MPNLQLSTESSQHQYDRATNKPMICDYVGDVVIEGRRILEGVISGERAKNGDRMYEYFTKMAANCRALWEQ